MCLCKRVANKAKVVKGRGGGRSPSGLSRHLDLLLGLRGPRSQDIHEEKNDLKCVLYRKCVNQCCLIYIVVRTVCQPSVEK